ncbi:MAG: TolC family protein [Gemmatimonadetes bacterium]|nr:TolC family protein [Gemmatimonadota bacterium]
MRWARPLALSFLTLTHPGQALGVMAAQGPDQPSDSLVLTLSEAVTAALAQHPSVAAGQARLDGARALTGEAEAARLPWLAVDGVANRFQEPMVVAPLHGFDIRQPPEFDRVLVQASASVSYTVFDGGARGARIDRARAQAAEAGVGVAASRITLVLSVVETYLRARATRELLDAHDRRIAALTAERDRVERLLAVGRAARVEVLRVEAALSQAQAERIAAAAQLDVAQRDLTRAMGADLDRVRRRSLASVALGPGAAPAGREDVLARALAGNADIGRARSRVGATAAGRDEARAAWLPKLQLAGRFVEYGGGGGDFQGEWQGGVQLSYPLFTGGQRVSTSERAAAEERAAREDLRLAELRVGEVVDRALAALESAVARVAALTAAEARAGEVARIEQLALDVGAGVQTDYLTAEAELLSVRAALTEARQSRVLAAVELARVMGDLSAEWVDRNLEMQP